MLWGGCCQILLFYIRSPFTASFPSQSEARQPEIVLPCVFLYRGPRLNGKGDLDRRRSRSGDICLFPSLIEHACSAAVAELGASENCEYTEQIRFCLFNLPDPARPRSIEVFYSRPTSNDSTTALPHGTGRGLCSKQGVRVAGCSGSISACRLSDSAVGRGRFLARTSRDMLDRNLRHATARCSGP